MAYSLETFKTVEISLNIIENIPENSTISFTVDNSLDMDSSNNIIFPTIYEPSTITNNIYYQF